MFTTRSPSWQIQGLVGHYGFSVVMTLFYAAWGRKHMPGPWWLKGILFMQMENSVLYPGAKFVERFHAGVKSGQVPSNVRAEGVVGADIEACAVWGRDGGVLQVILSFEF